MVKRARQSNTRTRPRKKARTMMRRVPRNLGQLRTSAIQFTRTVNTGAWFPGTTVTNDFWRYFSFSTADIPSFSEIAAMFDQYKIAAYKVTFRPRQTGFDGSNTTDTTLPGITNNGVVSLHVINDARSMLAPSGTYTRATFNTFLEQGNVRSSQALRPVSVYVKPSILNSLAAGYTQYVKAPWLRTDAGGAGVPHYGFHVYMTDNNLAGVFSQGFDIFVKFYIQAKGMR